MIWKIFFTFDFHTSVTELFPVVVLKKKYIRFDSFTDNESKPSQIVVERSETMLILIHIIADQNSVFYTHFLSPTDQKYAE